jgi:hypothetical protein
MSRRRLAGIVAMAGKQAGETPALQLHSALLG